MAAWTLDVLDELLRDRKTVIESRLATYLETLEDVPPILVEAMRHSLMAGGKRLRPHLVVLACEAVGGSIEAALAAACAVEMVHTYSLIHDDLPAMDDDELRRGQPTCHVRYGEALAILAGDALLTYAFQVICEGYPAATAAVLCLELAQGAGGRGMVGGQVYDLAAENRLDTPNRIRDPEQITLELLETIHSRKTGALYRACLRMGFYAARTADPAGQVSPCLGMLDRFGRAFGLAFQITDDLLDVQSDSQRTGKKVGKDAARGKLTFPGLLGIEASLKRAAALANEAIAAIEPLGDRALPLQLLAKRLLHRDH